MQQERPKTFVIGLGGNAILRANEKGTIEEQYSNLRQTGEQLLELLASESRIVITHGNGPQVGNLLLASEIAKDTVPPLPLDICGAATQGLMGFMIQQTLANALRKRGLRHNITTVVTQVVVDKEDPAFKHPSKPVGPFYSLNEAQKLRQEKGWEMIEDAKRGYRRVVPSPKPVKIQQARIIKSMLDAGEIVVAVGGGGIPSAREKDRSLRGVEAVIDKDYASSRLAIEIDADVLLFLTAVEKVFRDFGLPSQKALNHLTVAEAKELLAEGQFGTGSMEPKIVAAIEFLQEVDELAQPSLPRHEREVIITLPETAMAAIQGKTGTRITR
jgi:carbamate kinase